MATFFTDEEVKGLNPRLVDLIDEARGFAEIPFILTSGYRNPEHNAEIGGVSDSAHTKGLAVDIKKPDDPLLALKMVWALGLAGFDRIEIATQHIHVDIDGTKPHPVMWFGVSK